MAVPFTFPDENDEAEIVVVLRQLQMLLSDLIIELKKQRPNPPPNTAKGLIAVLPIRSGPPDSPESSVAVDSLAYLNTTCQLLANASTTTHVAIPRRSTATEPSCENAKDPHIANVHWEKVDVVLRQIADTFHVATEEENCPGPEPKSGSPPPREEGGMWSWLVPHPFSPSSICTTAVLCVVGWRLLR